MQSGANGPARRSGLVADLPIGRAGAATTGQVRALQESIRETLVQEHLRLLPLEELERRLLAVDISCARLDCLENIALVAHSEVLVGGLLDCAGGREGAAAWSARPRERRHRRGGGSRQVKRDERRQPDSRRAGGRRPQQTEGAGPCRLELWLFDARQRKDVASVEEACSACSEPELRRLAVASTKRLLAAGQSVIARLGRAGSATIFVRSMPRRARISLAGRVVGETDAAITVTVGQHTVILELAGHEPSVHQLSVEDGGTAVVTATLVPGDASPGRRAATRRVLKWVALGAGLAALAGGITLIAVDGRASCQPSWPLAECPQRFESGSAGLGLAAGGGMAAAAAAIFFFLDRKAEGTERRAAGAALGVSATGKGAAGTLSLSF